jgi:hypothetical protein
MAAGHRGAKARIPHIKHELKLSQITGLIQVQKGDVENCGSQDGSNEFL